MIDIAIIPPGALAETYCEGRPFQMALAGELVHRNGTSGPNPDYTTFYNQAWKSRSVHWLLDNGAWEGERLDEGDLLRVAHRYGATEVVAPDVLGNPVDTLELTVQFLSVLQDVTVPAFERKPSVAAVVHGQSQRQSIAFVEELHARNQDRLIKTFSISRTTCYRSGNPTARFELALEIKRRYGDLYDIHLLGFSDHWPTELQHCASIPGLVRSLDTIAPFSFAYRGVPIESVGRIEVARPDNYFQLKTEDFDHALLERNIKTLDQWGRTSIGRQ